MRCQYVSGNLQVLLTTDRPLREERCSVSACSIHHNLASWCFPEVVGKSAALAGTLVVAKRRFKSSLVSQPPEIAPGHSFVIHLALLHQEEILRETASRGLASEEPERQPGANSSGKRHQVCSLLSSLHLASVSGLWSCRQMASWRRRAGANEPLSNL